MPYFLVRQHTYTYTRILTSTPTYSRVRLLMCYYLLHSRMENIVAIDPDVFKTSLPEWERYCAVDPLTAGFHTRRESGYLVEIAQVDLRPRHQHLATNTSPPAPRHQHLATNTSPPITHHRYLTTDTSPDTSHGSQHTFLGPHAPCLSAPSLLATYLLPTMYYVLLTTYYLLHTIYYSLLTTHYSLFTSCCLLLTLYCFLLAGGRPPRWLPHLGGRLFAGW